jgi:hypothetical protein
MALVECPDCGKMISDLAPACIQCGRPTVATVKSVVTAATDSAAEVPVSEAIVQHGRTNSRVAPEGSLPRTRTTEPQRARFSWKAAVAAILLGAVIDGIASAATNSQPGNMAWTVLWIYLSIRAWEYWRWKALIPIPAFVTATAVVGQIMLSLGADKTTDLIYWIVKATINIGGLVIVYLLLRISRKNRDQNGV